MVWKDFKLQSSTQFSEENIVAIIEDVVDHNQINIMTRILSSEAGFLRRDLRDEVLSAALDASTKAGTAEMTEQVIAAVKRVKYKIKNKVDLVAIAIRSGNHDAAEVMLRYYPVHGEDGEEVNFIELEEYEKSDTNIMVITTVTLFELAFSHANAPILEALVAAGARPDVRRESLEAVFKMRGLMSLLTKDSPETRDTMERMKNLKLPSLVLQYGLQQAIQHSSANFAEFCIDKGANVNGRYLNIGEKRRRQRLSMLCLAVKSGSGPMVKMLLENGARLKRDELDIITAESLSGLGRIEEHFSMDWEEIVLAHSRTV